MEILKQKLHAPLAVEKQVVILFALTRGMLDSVSVDKILTFEEQLFDYIDGKYPNLFEVIRTTKDLPDEEELKAAIEEFKEVFSASNDAGKSAVEELKEKMSNA
mgnify:FL=1